LQIYTRGKSIGVAALGAARSNLRSLADNQKVTTAKQFVRPFSNVDLESLHALCPDLSTFPWSNVEPSHKGLIRKAPFTLNGMPIQKARDIKNIRGTFFSSLRDAAKQTGHDYSEGRDLIERFVLRGQLLEQHANGGIASNLTRHDDIDMRKHLSGEACPAISTSQLMLIARLYAATAALSGLLNFSSPIVMMLDTFLVENRTIIPKFDDMPNAGAP
jgi:hypothetical protein